eukprot:TRINITY_DN45570_c0_g1_i2.p1 TRINITY_DN45570_c0_g1~~TRINITY_DN45570_c0_g1_i2.p1  ORF type:complete len:480 (-),score=103.65 TRINITY_DN45570_c0_g1_i2:175-1614(-)
MTRVGEAADDALCSLLEQAKRQFSQAQDALLSADEALQARVGQLRDLRVSCKAAKESEEHALSIVDQLRKKLCDAKAEAREQISALEADLRRRDSDVARLEAELAVLRKKVKTLEVGHRDSKSLSGDQRQQVTRLEEIVVQLEKRCAKQQAVIDGFHRKSGDSREENGGAAASVALVPLNAESSPGAPNTRNGADEERKEAAADGEEAPLRRRGRLAPRPDDVKPRAIKDKNGTNGDRSADDSDASSGSGSDRSRSGSKGGDRDRASSAGSGAKSRSRSSRSDGSKSKSKSRSRSREKPSEATPQSEGRLQTLPARPPLRRRRPGRDGSRSQDAQRRAAAATPQSASREGNSKGKDGNNLASKIKKVCIPYLRGSCSVGTTCEMIHLVPEQGRKFLNHLRKTDCRMGVNCSKQDCVFRHPPGRRAADKQEAASRSGAAAAGRGRSPSGSASRSRSRSASRRSRRRGDAADRQDGSSDGR